MLKDIYEWMLINCDKLVQAIKDDGKFAGPTSEPLLDAAFKMPTPGRTKSQARELLLIRMKLAGIHELAPFGKEE
jgi:hypothetical protein